MKTHIEQLFYDTRHESPDVKDNTGSDILINEGRTAIESMKKGKSPGLNTNADFLKLFDEDSVRWLTDDVFNKIYCSEKIPHEWLSSEFITLPKKPGAKECEDFRTISLMSDILKLFLKIIHRRIYRICEEQIAPTQFWFRDAVGVHEMPSIVSIFCFSDAEI